LTLRPQGLGRGSVRKGVQRFIMIDGVARAKWEVVYSIMFLISLSYVEKPSLLSIGSKSLLIVKNGYKINVNINYMILLSFNNKIDV
jgi:hypothetical protein